MKKKTCGRGGGNLLVSYCSICTEMFAFQIQIGISYTHTDTHTHTHTLYNPLYYFDYKIGYCTRQKNESL